VARHRARGGQAVPPRLAPRYRRARQHGRPGAPAKLHELALPAAGDILVVVGPEGGVSQAERAAFGAAGAVAARLGPTVLRTSTAGAAAATVLLSRTARW